MSAESLYLDLLKRTLTGMVYEDPPFQAPWLARDGYQQDVRATGFDYPQHAPCMIGLRRLGNVQECVEQVLADGVPGDLAECGVWRGGTCIFMRALLKLRDVTDRLTWVIDSFQGLPPREAAEEGWTLPAHAALAVPLDEVRRNFALYGMLDDQVQFVPGWFSESLPGPVGTLAVLRLDGDLYRSQLDVLTHLYPLLSPGGYVIIDDSHLPGCARAVREYREAHDITESVCQVDDYAVCWRKLG